MPDLKFNPSLLVLLASIHSEVCYLCLRTQSQAVASVTFCQGAIEVRMHPIDENRGSALIFTGVGSLFTAIAAVLLEYPTFATIFAFFGAIALAVALRDARGGR
jgi:hypothetical protein